MYAFENFISNKKYIIFYCCCTYVLVNLHMHLESICGLEMMIVEVY